MMRQDTSYGIIPLCIKDADWEVLLVQHHAGHWAFPKGHAEEGENPQQTAERELKEETGLDISLFLSAPPFIENYSFYNQSQKISKTVYYYIALVKGAISNQEEEIQDSEWLPLSAALERMTFREGKELLISVAEFLKTVDEQGSPLIT